MKRINFDYSKFSDTLPAVVTGGDGVVVVAVSAHITVQVATPDESFLSDMNINFMGFVLSTSGAFVLQKLKEKLEL